MNQHRVYAKPHTTIAAQWGIMAVPPMAQRAVPAAHHLVAFMAPVPRAVPPSHRAIYRQIRLCPTPPAHTHSPVIAIIAIS